jgi:hypothetical protein
MVDVERSLRSIAAGLDGRSRPVDPDAVRSSSSGPRWRPTLRPALAVAAAVVVLVVGVALLAERSGDDADPTVVPPTTTATDADDGADDVGIAVFGQQPELTYYGLDGVVTGVEPADLSSLEQIFPPNLLVFGGGVRNDVDPAEAPEGCEGAVGARGVRVALCGGQPESRATLDRIDAHGAAVTLVERPLGRSAGRWRWALPSADGSTLLAQWEDAECELQSVWLVSVADGSARPALGAPDVGAIALGWLPDGRAAIQVVRPTCGAAGPDPAVHAVDVLGEGTTQLLVPMPDGGTAFLWRRDRGARDDTDPVVAALARAADELGLERSASTVDDLGRTQTTLTSPDGRVQITVGPTTGSGLAYAPLPDAIDSGPVELPGGFAATSGTAQGPYVAVRCGDHVWAATALDAVHAFDIGAAADVLSALVPHLYCTLGPAPLTNRHEDLSPEAGAAARAVGDALLAFARDPNPTTLAGLPFADHVLLAVDDLAVRTATPEELLDPATWVLDVQAFEQSGPFSALELLAGMTQPLDVQLRGTSSPTRQGPPIELEGYEDIALLPLDVPSDRGDMWFEIDVYQHPVTGEITGVVVLLWEP